MAHAIQGYPGACKNIHGHSYELHVSFAAAFDEACYIPAPGFIIDFKDIKTLVRDVVIQKFDHNLLLSADFIAANPSLPAMKNLVIFEAEPTAENMLLYIKMILQKNLPAGIQLVYLKLFETTDSYAEWTDNTRLGNLQESLPA